MIRRTIFVFVFSTVLTTISCLAFSFEIHSQQRRSPIKLVQKLTFTSTKLFSSSSDDDTDDEFMKSLRNRMTEISDRSTKLPLVVLDSMLPRQVLKIEVQNPLLMELIRQRIAEENPSFGMIGMARLNTGMQLPLRSGVEVVIQGKPEFISKKDNVSDKDNGNNSGLRVELKAGRRFEIIGEPESVKEGWTEARVNFLDSDEEAAEEEKLARAASTKEGSEVDRMSLARAMSNARQFTTPNINMEGNKSLVDRWIELARQNERQPGQIDKLLQDLGEIPPEENPSERAFWVGALINPIPAMGVAMEIRPALLSYKTAEERVQVAIEGILKSIKHMDGSARMW